MKRLLMAGLMAASLLVAPMGVSVTPGGQGPGLSLVPGVPTAYADRILAKPTGDADLDAYCEQVAALINEMTEEAERYNRAGNFDEYFAWTAAATAILNEATANGCNFGGVAMVDSDDLPDLEVSGAEAQRAGSGQIQPQDSPGIVADGPRRPLVAADPMPVLTEATNPDLRVDAIEVRARDGGRCVIRGDRNTVSATIKNAGDLEAVQFAVEVTVGGERRGVTTVGSLAAGPERVVEIRNVGIAEGERSLRVTADSANAVAEQDETNNARTVEVDCTRR